MQGDAEAKVNILLVDDQPENLLALEAILEPLGQTLVKASSAREALKRLLDEDFALILLDVQMPEMDGFEMAALVRERERSKATPIIFLTAAHKTETQIFRGYEVGAVDYILKPVVPEILKSKVAVFVDLARKGTLIARQAEQLRQAEETRHQKEIEEARAFNHAVSHDLRAPLRQIVSFSELLLRAYGEKLGPEGRDYLNRLCGAAHKTTRLVDSMLQLSSAIRGELHEELVDLTNLAAALVRDFRREEPQRTVDCVIQEGLTATGDPNLLHEAVENLLANSWKFTRKKERPHIEFGLASLEGGPVFFVRDDGVGFDMKHADRMFQPFHRLHTRSEFEGTGLGLATTQRIIERHGGRIWCEGEAGKGATFYFTLEKAP